MSIVHLQIYAVDSFKAVVVDLGQVTNLQELILQLKPSDLRSNWLIVFSFQILQFKWIHKGLSPIDVFESAFSL